MTEDGLPNSETTETPETPGTPEIPGNTEGGELDLFSPSGDIDIYVPKGHVFSIYSLDENLTLYLTVFGGSIFAFAIVVLLMNALGGDRRYG